MKIEYFWSLVATCIVSAGGVGGIITAVIKFSSDFIAEKVASRYEYKLEKALEKYKTELSKKEFISKTRFETAFKMYQELSEKNLAMVYCAGQSILVLREKSLDLNEIEGFIEYFCNCLNDAEVMNKRYAPFIDEDLYYKYYILNKDSSEIFRLMKAWKQYRAGNSFCCHISEGVYHNQSEVEQAIIEKQKALSGHSDEILKQLRDYLTSLEVIEN